MQDKSSLLRWFTGNCALIKRYFQHQTDLLRHRYFDRVKMAKAATTLILIGLCLASASAVTWDHLALKFDVLTNGYFPIELTQEKMLKGCLLKDSEWIHMHKDKQLNVDFYSYGKDPRVSIGYDTYGNIAAVRTAYIIEDLSIKAKKNNLDFPYDFSTKPLYSTGKFWGKHVYYTTVLFASPEELKAGGRNYTINVLAENIYVKINGEYTIMPKDEQDAPSVGFTKQACFPGMGQHYFLDMTKDSDCADQQGVFLLYHKSELIGMGLIPFGSFTSDKRTWFESPPSTVAKLISPNSPACLGEWVDNYGLIGLHLFFKKHPRLTFCPMW